MGLSHGQSLCPLHVPVPTINPLPLIHGIVPWTVFCVLACSRPNYPSASLDPWDCPMDCLLCHLHVPVPTIHPLPLIHGIVPWTVFCVLACSRPNYPSASLDPWDCPMDCLLCHLHVPVPTIHPLPLIHGIVPWTVFCVPLMFLSQLSIP